MIVDPPRRGCDATFLAQLVDFAPARVVYVSCGPDTQARDLRRLLDRAPAEARALVEPIHCVLCPLDAGGLPSKKKCPFETSSYFVRAGGPGLWPRRRLTKPTGSFRM